MDHFDLFEVDILRVTPQHGQNKVVDWWDRLVLVLEEHVQEILSILKKNKNLINNPTFVTLK